MSERISRRQLIQGALYGAAAMAIKGQTQPSQWQPGAVRHLLPAVNHDRLLLKASFNRPLAEPPTLRAGLRTVTGVRLDFAGRVLFVRSGRA